MKNVVHVMCLTFGDKYSIMVEVEGPEDWTDSARTVSACEKARQRVGVIKMLPLTNKQYLGTIDDVIYVN